MTDGDLQPRKLITPRGSSNLTSGCILKRDSSKTGDPAESEMTRGFNNASNSRAEARQILERQSPVNIKSGDLGDLL